MSTWQSQTTTTGGIPNISFIQSKPENVGTEFKTISCPATVIMTYLEWQRGKYGVTGQRHFKDLEATASCTVRLSEGASHKHVDDAQEVVLGDSWFSSVKAAVALTQHVYEAILQVKQNHGLHPKDTIT